MKTVKYWVMAASVAALLQATSASAETNAMTFGVVDMNKVMQTTDAAKGIFGELEAKRKEYQGQITKEEDSLRAAEQAIVKEKEKLSAEEFDQKRKEFKEKVEKAQGVVEGRKKTLEQAFNKSMLKLRTEAAKIISEVAKEKGFGAVFTQDAVILASQSLDITDVVVEKLNKNVKSIPIEWSSKKK